MKVIVKNEELYTGYKLMFYMKLQGWQRYSYLQIWQWGLRSDYQSGSRSAIPDCHWRHLQNLWKSHYHFPEMSTVPNSLDLSLCKSNSPHFRHFACPEIQKCRISEILTTAK